MTLRLQTLTLVAALGGLMAPAECFARGILSDFFYGPSGVLSSSRHSEPPAQECVPFSNQCAPVTPDYGAVSQECVPFTAEYVPLSPQIVPAPREHVTLPPPPQERVTLPPVLQERAIQPAACAPSPPPVMASPRVQDYVPYPSSYVPPPPERAPAMPEYVAPTRVRAAAFTECAPPAQECVPLAQQCAPPAAACAPASPQCTSCAPHGASTSGECGLTWFEQVQCWWDHQTREKKKHCYYGCMDLHRNFMNPVYNPAATPSFGYYQTVWRPFCTTTPLFVDESNPFLEEFPVDSFDDLPPEPQPAPAE